jgi:hypothetical protein
MARETSTLRGAKTGDVTRRRLVTLGLSAGAAALGGIARAGHASGRAAQSGGAVQPKDTAEIEAIKQLKARYFRFLDTRQWAEWGQCFTEDCQMRVEQQPGVVATDLRGRQAIVDGVSKALSGSRTVHHGHMPEIEIVDATTARGIWAMYDYVSWSPERELKGYGHYHEIYRKAPGGRWQIASLLLTRLRVDMTGSR